MHKVIVSNLLAAHALSGCDTAPSLYGIGKQKASKALFLVLFLVLSCIGGYSLWRRWHPALSRCWCFCCCCRSSGELGDEDPNSEQESTRSCCPPPHYSRCSSLRHAPPPYTEVTSKPDLYPLVISYGDSGKTGPGSSYLMVQYFRNYIVRPVVTSLNLSSCQTGIKHEQGQLPHGVKVPIYSCLDMLSRQTGARWSSVGGPCRSGGCIPSREVTVGRDDQLEGERTESRQHGVAVGGVDKVPAT
uniref:WW domain binding protein VOPP1 n=1 Tax=Timema poppense TaxID=170557 RepID=A0A7R9H6V3_TIMPO|nr:unnamed protein product [Timema poppensis]